MPSTFYGINLALRAVLSHQNAMQVIEHNVANANTPGYRRQQAVLVAGLPYAPPNLRRDSTPGQYGGSIMVDRVQRFNLEFFDGRYRREVGESKRWAAERDVLQQVEATLAETGADGLTPKLDAFWAGWQALGADPTNTALRADLLERSRALVDGINRRTTALQNLRTDQNLAIRQRVEDINTAAGNVAALNVEIARVLSVGDEPNDLLDDRDRLLDQLSQLAGAESHTQPNGEMIVSIGGHVLVMGGQTFQVQATAGSLPTLVWEDGQPMTAPRGEVAGLLHARDTVIVDQQTSLDAFARDLITRVNAQHRLGVDLNNAAGGDFFTPPPAGSPFTVSLSANVDTPAAPAVGLARIAAAAAAAAVGQPGDGNNAQALFGLKSLPMGGGAATLNDYYTAQVGRLGLSLRQSKLEAQNRELVAESMDKQRDSVGGVNLDEEAANLAQTQRAYEAATRLMTVMDDMINRIINGMGRVGL